MSERQLSDDQVLRGVSSSYDHSCERSGTRGTSVPNLLSERLLTFVIELKFFRKSFEKPLIEKFEKNFKTKYQKTRKIIIIIIKL